MTLRINRLRWNHGTRICLSGELLRAHIATLRAEIDQVVQSVTLDLHEVNIVDIDGIRFLNECQAQGIRLLNCPPYVRKWMLQERQMHRDAE